MDQLTHRPRTSPRDFFLYLFATGALYFSAVDLIVLLRQYVNYFFPDPLSYSGFTGLSNAMRLSMAFLIVLYPAYVIVMSILGRDTDREPAKQELWVRRWSLYLTLFLSGVTMVGDLIYLVYSFLGGDFTLRFILQALAILIVAAAVFGYYLFLLRRGPGTYQATRRTLAVVSLVVIIGLIVGAFFIVGSPAKNRARAWDEQRVNDLSSIQSQVVNYWQRKEQLPKTLADLNDPISNSSIPTDPETKAAYEYSVTGEKMFQLCATFAASSVSGEKTYGGPMALNMPSPGAGDNWQHEAGRQCFTRTIDPQLYPPFSASSQPAPVPPKPVTQ
jgi:hypothetical protein